MKQKNPPRLGVVSLAGFVLFAGIVVFVAFSSLLDGDFEGAFVVGIVLLCLLAEIFTDPA